MPQLLRQTRPDVPHLIFSLLFIPHETSYSGMFPTLLLGWTLNYELYFYALFAAALLLSPRFAPLICGFLLSIVVVAIALSGSDNETLKFYARPIVFEFVLGILVFYAVDRLDRRATVLRNAPWIKWVLYALSVGSFGVLAAQEMNGGFGIPAILSSGLPAMLLVLSAILIETIYGERANNKLVFLVGESSYILYLIHPYIIYGILRLIVRPKMGLNVSTVAAIVPCLMVLATVIAVLIHVWFEKPLMRFLRRTLIRDSASSPRPALTPLVLQDASQSA